jgi:hypothetical protein
MALTAFFLVLRLLVVAVVVLIMVRQRVIVEALAEVLLIAELPVPVLQAKEMLEVWGSVAQHFPAVLVVAQVLRGLLFQQTLRAVMVVQGCVAQLQVPEFFTLVAVVVHLVKEAHQLTPVLVALEAAALEARTVIFQPIDTLVAPDKPILVVAGVVGLLVLAVLQYRVAAQAALVSSLFVTHKSIQYPLW